MTSFSPGRGAVGGYSPDSTDSRSAVAMSQYPGRPPHSHTAGATARRAKENT